MKKYVIGLVAAFCLLICLPMGVHAENSDWRYYTKADHTIEITGYRGDEGHVVIPEKIDGLTVTSIGSEAFNYEDFYSIHMPDTIKSIGDKAFASCSKLVEIKWSTRLETIGKEAFRYCIALTKVILPDSLRSLSEKAFYDCSSLSELKLSRLLTKIENSTFYDTDIRNLTIPGNIKEIGDHAFNNISLTQRSVILEEGVERIGKYAFAPSYNYGFTITLPKSIKFIAPNGFGFYPNVVTAKCYRGTASCVYVKSNKIRYILYDPGVTSLKISAKSMTLKPQKTGQLRVTELKPANAVSKELVYTSSNPKIASVDAKGKITAKKPGKATITVTAKVPEAERVSASCVVTVEAVKLSKTSATVYVGQKTLQLTAKGGWGTIKWKSSNSKIAAVSAKGVVTPKKAGTATITATRNGISLRCKISVKNLSLNKKSLNLAEGCSYQLQLKGTPRSVKWISSNKKVVTVSRTGRVKAVGTGNAVITVKAGSKTFRCKVRVEYNQTTLTEREDSEFSYYITKLTYTNGTIHAEGHFKNNKDKTVTEISSTDIKIYYNRSIIAACTLQGWTGNLYPGGTLNYNFTIPRSRVYKAVDLRARRNVKYSVSGRFWYYL